MYFTSMRGVRNIFIRSPTVNRSLVPIEKIIILKWFLIKVFLCSQRNSSGSEQRLSTMFLKGGNCISTAM